MDDLDRRLIDLFAAEPRIGVLEASRRLGVARGTVQARLDKLGVARRDHRLGTRAVPEALGLTERYKRERDAAPERAPRVRGCRGRPARARSPRTAP